MGPCGCGKSTVGILLAQQLDARFIEGDDFHPESNRQKMASGQALDDDDRKPWMALLNQALKEAGQEPVVLSCSALRKSYRDWLRDGQTRPLHFVCLTGSRELLAARLAGRNHEFMNPKLLDSQLATLEIPQDEPNTQVLDVALSPEKLVEAIKSKL